MVAKYAIAWVLGSVALLARCEPVPFLRNAAVTSTVVRVGRGDLSNSTVARRSDAMDYAGSIEADGGTELVPARVDMRCRYTFLNDKHSYKLYRLFMAPGVLSYPDWCKSIVHAINSQCGKEVKANNIVWRRCDADGKDMLWQKGFVATFELNVPEDERPLCVPDALMETVPGSVVDWMGHRGCYESYGFELEF